MKIGLYRREVMGQGGQRSQEPRAKKDPPGAAQSALQGTRRRSPRRPGHAILFPDAADRPNSSRSAIQSGVDRAGTRSPPNPTRTRARPRHGGHFCMTSTPAGAAAGPRRRPTCRKQNGELVPNEFLGFLCKHSDRTQARSASDGCRSPVAGAPGLCPHLVLAPCQRLIHGLQACTLYSPKRTFP